LYIKLVFALLLLIAAYSFVVSGFEYTHIEANRWPNRKREINMVFYIVDEIIWRIEFSG
jgi:hypothetical protein